jgi:hypothetical protein
MADTVNIICMKWGTKFSPRYVNRLYGMVKRHLSLPFRFVCFTEDSSGIRPEVDIKPLPPMDLPPGKERGWRKLSTFQNPLFDLQGPTLFLDLDIVIIDSIDEFFSLPGQFRIIHDWLRPKRIEGNSSVYRFEANEHPGVFQHFMDHIDDVKANHRHEQSYLSSYMHDAGMLEYWPKEWCISFKRNCLQPFPMSLWKAPEFPQGAKIVVFHGNPNPQHAIDGEIKGFLRFLRPTPWVAEHWRE